MANIQELWQKHSGKSVCVYRVLSSDEAYSIQECSSMPEGVFQSDWIGCGESLKYMLEDKAVFDYYIPENFSDVELLDKFDKKRVLAKQYLKNGEKEKKFNSFYSIETLLKGDGLSIDRKCSFSDKNFLPQLICYLGYSKIYLCGSFNIEPELIEFYEQEFGVKFYNISKFF